VADRFRLGQKDRRVARVVTYFQGSKNSYYRPNLEFALNCKDEYSPLERISMEMVWRGLYHFNHAFSSGKAIDPVDYLAALENRVLGVVKAIRKPPKNLDFSPYFYDLFKVALVGSHFRKQRSPTCSVIVAPNRA
jgi:hypothetical protein